MTKPFDRWNPSNEPGEKTCTQCKTYRPPEGGVQIISADKLHQRWICKRCKDRLEADLSRE